MKISSLNAAILERELDWFSRVLETAINIYFKQPCDHGDIHEIEAPQLEGNSSGYACLVQECGMNFDERIVLLLAMIPHVRPQLLDTLFIRNKNSDRGFTEFGGWKGAVHGGFLPTGETAAFILAGNNLARRFEVAALFEPDHFFARMGILRLNHRTGEEPFFSGSLCIATDFLQKITSGMCHKPDFTMNFPAKLITTRLDWDDLVLSPDVMEDIGFINTWISSSQVIMEEWGLKKAIKPGYRSLFYGPPGTGKTLTATLVGASNGVDVYRIDLSMVVSKFIGETEKNLASVFDQAEHKNWILFFDEADALFGKRTQTTSSNDRYANQEISYLLQRVEDFPGVVILATNLKANIDEAFARRFQSVVYFPMPDSDQRLRLWQGILGKKTPPMAGDVSLERLADDFELSGGAITNVVRYAAIRALMRSDRIMTQDDFLKGVGRELMKEGRTMQTP